MHLFDDNFDRAKKERSDLKESFLVEQKRRADNVISAHPTSQDHFCMSCPA